MQLHAIDEEENLDEVLGNDGALRVIEEYQAAGKIRFVGLTGHTAPAQFERMLGEYDFDTVLNPAGPVNRVWNDFIGTSMAAARRLGMGVVAMKVMAYGQVPPEDRPDYLRYTMGQDVDVAIVGMDTVEQVEENVRVAEAFAPLETQQERALLERALALVPEARKDLWWLPQERIASIEVVQGLWSGEPLDFRGSHYEISGLTGTPSPHQPGGPPIIVGGGGKRVLTEAALRADIVGLNASLHAGSVGPETALSALGERFLERRNWVEEAAGDRFPEIELQMNTFMTAVTNTTSEANEMFEGMAPMFGLSAEQARTIPMVLAGTISDVCDQLHRYRELYGTSYWVIHEGEVDAMAPVVAKMTDI